MNKNDVISAARRVIKIQSASLIDLESYINDDFFNAVERVASAKGRLVLSGIGKSAIIAQKITATLNSTGTPSIFMHAADAIHGDLGMIQKDDVVMVISKSGDSPEIKVLIPLLKGFGNTLIGMAGNTGSYLAHHCDILINTTVLQEACPNNLAPTSSSTAQMVMGDALAICLMELKGFKSSDFARFHPGGSLGKKLYIRVSDIINKKAAPSVSAGLGIKDVIVQITQNRLGAVAVLDTDGKILGIITDGDIRRMLEKHDDFISLKAEDIMGATPKTIDTESLAAEALQLMKEHNINHLLVTQNELFVGIVHLQDLIREGII
ncbi:MAG: KpsF/GutQ family sugar-phosphate isomerase [Ferruginibacter sp.]|nr:KpsF/GutQ family sugar-phosphate isomerase [Ferruginibacter sp.]